LSLRLIGRRANRSGVGARVKVTAGDQAWVDWVHSGRGYQSDFGQRLHFGLGPAARISQIEVRWPGGGVSKATDLQSDQTIVLDEGQTGFFPVD
jgi:hypothetical protein